MAKDLAVPETEELTLPHTGELISLQDTISVAMALQALRALEARSREAKQILTGALVAESQRQGTRTMHLPGMKVEVRGGSKTVWDVDALAQGLMDAGLPDERIIDVIKQEITYTVNAREAKRVAGANPEYAAVVEAAQTQVDENPYIVVSKAI